MKKEIINIDEKNKTIRVTTLNERWYGKIKKNNTYEWYPSATWICSYYYKGIGFYKWLANKGWDEAEAIKVAAGGRGSKIHRACEDIDNGLAVSLNSKYINPNTEQEEDLTVDEYAAVMNFRDWIDKFQPKLIANEMTVFNEEYHYAGTLDRIYEIDGEIYIVDLKTSREIWEEYILQISSYSYCDFDLTKLGIELADWNQRKLTILQIGYTRNKNGYKFTEVEDKFNLFLMAKEIWANENPGSKPKERDFPEIIQSQFRKENKNG